MNDMFSAISSKSWATQFGYHKAENQKTRAGQKDFQSFLNSEKIELSNAAKKSKELIALVKEVGFTEFTRIVRTVKQIQRALTRAMQDFPKYREEIQAMIDSYDNQMPRSITEALGRLQEMLDDSPLPREIIDTTLRYVKEEMNQSSDAKVYDDKMNLLPMKS